LEQAFEALFPCSCPADITTRNKNEDILAINTTFLPRREIMEVNDTLEGAIQKSGKPNVSYAVVDSTGAGAGLIDSSVNAKTLEGLMPVSGTITHPHCVSAETDN